MEKEQNHMTEKILNLTLDIIYLLTGEDYTLVRKTYGHHMIPSNHPTAPGEWSRNQSSKIKPSLQYSTSEINNDKEILEVTQKIIKLLTREVPIRCHDVTVYFSMEEWDYLEGHKDLRKDIMMEDQPPLISPDCSRNTSESCLHTLHTRDSTTDLQKIPQDNRAEGIIVFKAEVLGETEYSNIGDDRSKEKDISSKISTDPNLCQNNVQGLAKEEGHLSIKEEEAPIEISRDGQYRKYKTKECPVVSLNGRTEHCDIAANPSGEIPIVPNLNPIPQMLALSSDSSTHEETITEHLYPGTYPVCRTVEPIARFVSNDSCGKELQNVSQPKPDITTPCSECGNGSKQCCNFGSNVVTKTYPCSQCGRDFSQKSNLLRHLRFHTVDKPYTCTACGWCFSQKSDLLRHQRVHTGEKPYSCQVCGRGFAQKSNLFRHLRSHSGEKPFSCSDCGKCFAKKQDMVSHQTKHTKKTG